MLPEYWGHSLQPSLNVFSYSVKVTTSNALQFPLIAEICQTGVHLLLNDYRIFIKPPDLSQKEKLITRFNNGAYFRLSVVCIIFRTFELVNFMKPRIQYCLK